jgi:colicin import membrane protein
MENVMKISLRNVLLSALLICSLNSAAFADAPADVAAQGSAKVDKAEKAAKKGKSSKRKGKKSLSKSRHRKFKKGAESDTKERSPRLRSRRSGGRAKLWMGKDKSENSTDVVRKEKAQSEAKRVNRAGSKRKADKTEGRGNAKRMKAAHADNQENPKAEKAPVGKAGNKKAAKAQKKATKQAKKAAKAEKKATDAAASVVSASTAA